MFETILLGGLKIVFFCFVVLIHSPIYFAKPLLFLKVNIVEWKKKTDVESSKYINWLKRIANSVLNPTIMSQFFFFFLSSQNARPPLPSDCPVALSHLINRCWSSNPDKRPHFDEIVMILESYSDALDRDPDFFLSYKPPSGLSIIFRCLPTLKSRNKSSSLKV